MIDNGHSTIRPTYRIAVISSVPPDPNRIAGALILSRWLDHPQIDWTYIEPSVKPPNLLGRVISWIIRVLLAWRNVMNAHIRSTRCSGASDFITRKENNEWPSNTYPANLICRP
jgi:hypothetical protein